MSQTRVPAAHDSAPQHPVASQPVATARVVTTLHRPAGYPAARRRAGGRFSARCGSMAGSLVLLAVVLAPAAPAAAAEPINLNARTARDLAELCAAPPRQAGSDAKINFCHGFAQGTVDMALKQAGGERPFCFPSPTPRRTETLNQFVGWVKANADRQKLSSTDGFLRFMGEQFPCTK